MGNDVDLKSTIQVAVATPEPVTVDLGGVLYVGYRPKNAGTFRTVKRIQEAAEDPEKMLDEIHNWLKSIFKTADANKIFARLEDPKDGLDIAHIVELIQRMMETDTNPTM